MTKGLLKLTKGFHTLSVRTIKAGIGNTTSIMQEASPKGQIAHTLGHANMQHLSPQQTCQWENGWKQDRTELRLKESRSGEASKKVDILHGPSGGSFTPTRNNLTCRRTTRGRTPCLGPNRGDTNETRKPRGSLQIRKLVSQAPTKLRLSHQWKISPQQGGNLSLLPRWRALAKGTITNWPAMG